MVWLGAVAGCAVFGPDDSVAEQLRSHKRAFERQNIRSYFYDYQALCFCASIDPILIEVRDGVVVNATNKLTGQPIPPAQRATLKTIPQLYDYLIDAAERADEISADFDSELHLPTEVRIDFARHAADDELIVKTSNLQVIAALQPARAASLLAALR